MALFDFFFKRQRQVEAMVQEYLEQWEACLTQFRRAMGIYLEKGLCEEFDFAVERTHKLESTADDTRHAIEYRLYAKALLPEARDDILHYLEALDRIPNGAETVLFVLCCERIVIPYSFREGIGTMLEATYEAFDAVLELARRVFSRNRELVNLVRLVDEKESACDYHLRDLVTRIYADEHLDGFEKRSLRDLIVRLAELTDRAEKVADRVTIMGLKRRV